MSVNKKVYELVTNRVIEQLEKGVVPWRRPWVSGSSVAVNWVTQKPYRGINQFLLPFGGEYATFLQIKQAGGRVLKGERGHTVVFCKRVVKKVNKPEILELEEEHDKNQKDQIYFLYKTYTVFEINTQCEGIKSKRPPVPKFDHDPIKAAEQIIEGFIDRPKITFAPGRAYYKPFFDYISIPPMEDFEIAEEFYCTLFHELVHSTGHESRLNREGIVKSAGFKSNRYAFEELVAEMGAAMLCAKAGIDNSTIVNSAAYINSWLERLKKDNQLLIKAASHAQRAADYIQNVTFENMNNDEEAAS